MNVPTILIFGILLMGMGIFYIDRRAATVGIKGARFKLRGKGAIIIGSIYWLTGLSLFAAAMNPTSDRLLEIAVLLTLLVLFVTIFGIFFVQRAN